MICQVDLATIQAARQVVQEHARYTPVVTSDKCSEILGQPVYLKLESLQRTGSFKIRGASYKMAKLDAAGEHQAVMAISAGNHAQGVALAATQHGFHATVFMPENAPLSKIQATRNYGAEVLCRGQNFDEAYQAAMDWLQGHPVTFISPFDDDDIIAGQGTCALEILEQVPDLRTLVVPVGGGGLISGMAIAIKALKPEVRIIGVQTESVPSLVASFHEGELIQPDYLPTIADGIAVKRPAQRTFEVIQKYVDEMITVSEDAISHALFFAIQYKHLIVEGAGVVGLAAMLEGQIQAEGPMVIVVSGGNIDVKLLDSVINQGMSQIGRFLTFKTLIRDQPGSLRGVLSLLAAEKANVLHIQHARFRSNIPLNCTEVEIEVETRDHEHASEIVHGLQSAGYQVHRL